mmetsp:Transcript_11700/g.13244  ORF Transcript_11700/g.13244 Transcript_11700/m.13244 type:complete len:86 (-) Transcript_11700:14-271(-)
MGEEAEIISQVQIKKWNDWELVHNVCPYERLTLYNYLRGMNPNNSDQKVKQLILNEYMYYFKKDDMELGNGTSQRIKSFLDLKLQ